MLRVADCPFYILNHRNDIFDGQYRPLKRSWWYGENKRKPTEVGYMILVLRGLADNLNRQAANLHRECCACA